MLEWVNSIFLLSNSIYSKNQRTSGIYIASLSFPFQWQRSAVSHINADVVSFVISNGRLPCHRLAMPRENCIKNMHFPLMRSCRPRQVTLLDETKEHLVITLANKMASLFSQSRWKYGLNSERVYRWLVDSFVLK